MTKRSLATIAVTVFVSGLSSTSAFSVGQSPLSTLLSRSNNMDAAPVGFAFASDQSLRRGIVCKAASTGEAGETKTNQIYLLDEVDSIFDCVDKNGDGEITQEELKAHLVDEMGYSKKYTEYLFESIDTDSSGSISRDELRFAFYNFEALSMYMTFGMGGADITKRAAFKKMALNSAHSYPDLDSESDDLTGVSQESRDKLLLDDLADLIFEMIDTDKSGAISKEELSDHFDKVTEKLAKNAKDRATTKQAQEYVSAMFETLDVNKDGSICRDEIRAAFEKYDFKLLARTFGLKVYQSAM